MRTNSFVAAMRSTRPALALACLPLLGGCDRVLFDPAGDVARQQRDLIVISTGLMLLIILPVLIATALFAWRYSAKRKTKATYDPHFDHSTPLELLIWSAPLLIIICLGAITWTSTHLLDPYRPLDRLGAGRAIPEKTRPLDIQVVALDWKWLFIYPQQGIATVNDLAIPVGVPVRFTITSTSQMNTFFVPSMAGMVYAMPGMQTTLHAVFNRPTETWGRSANYSGAGFPGMVFPVHGVDAAGFQRWVQAAQASGKALTAPGYVKLEQPSESVPAMRFATVEPKLFDRVVNRCVEPGKPCLNDVMRHDMMGGGGNPTEMRAGAGMPQTNAAPPMNGDKPTGALLKPAIEKGGGESKFSPPKAPPGQKAPGDPKNRNLSLLSPRPGAPSAGPGADVQA